MNKLFAPYYWWYANKRLSALNVDILKDDGENYVFLAQRDMIELEIEWYRSESIALLLCLSGGVTIFGALSYMYFDVIHMFVSDISMKVYEFFSTMRSN